MDDPQTVPVVRLSEAPAGQHHRVLPGQGGR
eukprot:CAMPEP_0170219010 /NCGR_PEP_ID=MMETSP0116_2-20130129/9178_1 /TAXON_ID=400756 /ORGANISM="Durinskia baltica, Strain CSIRO CS-38" /LENGTH=30 /DNA_ID= /DNA_START= /DNA_END= /DNA_ORIENTATION=